MKAASANTWNRWKGQARRPSGRADRSWWLHAKSRDEFYRLAQAETPRMCLAPEANWVSQNIVGWRV